MFDRRDDGGFDLSALGGLPITCIKLTGLVELLFGEDQAVKLQIERNFLVRLPESDSPVKVEFRPYEQGWKPTGMQELASLFRSVVMTAEATPDAVLIVTFTTGASLTVNPDPQYEGWNLWWPGGQLGQPAGSRFA